MTLITILTSNKAGVSMFPLACCIEIMQTCSTSKVKCKLYIFTLCKLNLNNSEGNDPQKQNKKRLTFTHLNNLCSTNVAFAHASHPAVLQRMLLQSVAESTKAAAHIVHLSAHKCRITHTNTNTCTHVCVLFCTTEVL